MLTDPLPQYPVPVNGEFGAPRGVIGGINYGTHKGLDKSAPAGTPVPAAGAGRVVHSAGAFTPCGHIGAGNHIHVEHPGGLETRYNHLLARHVVVGQMVTTSTIVGSVGSSGMATGNHLHLEVLEGGVHVDPRRHIGGASVMGGRPATARLVTDEPARGTPYNGGCGPGYVPAKVAIAAPPPFPLPPVASVTITRIGRPGEPGDWDMCVLAGMRVGDEVIGAGAVAADALGQIFRLALPPLLEPALSLAVLATAAILVYAGARRALG